MSDQVQHFLYILMRDHLPPGVVAGIIEDFVKASKGLEVTFSNEHLAAYAQELAAVLRSEKPS